MTNLAALFGDEWARVCKQKNSYRDAQDREDFWQGICAKKIANPKYRFEHDFPVGHMPETSALPADPVAAKFGRQVCQELMAKIEARRAKVVLSPEETAKRSEIEKRLSEAADLGGDKFGLCLWPRRREA